MTIRVRAPATTANLGAGFDVAGAALDLVLHDAPVGAVEAALDELGAQPDVLAPPFLAPVVAEAA